MPTEGKRKRRGPHEYEIAVVSLGEAHRTRNFRLSRFKLVLLLLMGFAASIAVTIAVLVYTPVAMYVPIPNPGLERRYGRQIVQTQQRLNGLAEEVLTLKGYNLQLRRALGEDSTGGTQRASRAVRGAPQEEDPEVQNPVPWQEMGSAGNVTPVSMTGVSGGAAVMGEVPFPLVASGGGIHLSGLRCRTRPFRHGLRRQAGEPGICGGRRTGRLRGLDLR